MLECSKGGFRQMNKKEFLSILRESLIGEVNNDDIEQNIQYYDQYISTQNASEKEVIKVLGDPRLIAKTIIESSRIAKQKGVYSGYQTHSSDYYQQEEEYTNHNDNNHKSSLFQLFNIKWYHMVLFVLIVVLSILFIATIARIILGFLFAFAVPIILLMLVYSMFRKRF